MEKFYFVCLKFERWDTFAIVKIEVIKYRF